MSKIRNGGLDQYYVESCEQQHFGAAVVEGVNGGARGDGGRRVDTNISCKVKLVNAADMNF